MSVMTLRRTSLFILTGEKETSLEGLPNRRKVVTLPGPETMQAELVATGPVRKRESSWRMNRSCEISTVEANYAG